MRLWHTPAHGSCKYFLIASSPCTGRPFGVARYNLNIPHLIHLSNPMYWIDRVSRGYLTQSVDRASSCRPS